MPGRHFTVKTEWNYTRETDAGSFSHGVSEAKVNPHVLADKLLLTDKKLYHPGETIRLFGLILPEACVPKQGDPVPGKMLTKAEIAELTHWTGRTPDTLAAATTSPLAAAATEGRRCDRYQVTAILTPTTVDRAFSVVLRQPGGEVEAAGPDGAAAVGAEAGRPGAADSGVPVGAVRLLVHGGADGRQYPDGPVEALPVCADDQLGDGGMKSTQAAQIIGGLPVSNNTRPTLDVACGPLIIDDGQFEIELL